MHSDSADPLCELRIQCHNRYVCIVDGQGNVLLQRNIPTSPDELRALIAPFRESSLAN